MPVVDSLTIIFHEIYTMAHFSLFSPIAPTPSPVLLVFFSSCPFLPFCLSFGLSLKTIPGRRRRRRILSFFYFLNKKGRRKKADKIIITFTVSNKQNNASFTRCVVCDSYHITSVTRKGLWQGKFIIIIIIIIIITITIIIITEM